MSLFFVFHTLHCFYDIIMLITDCEPKEIRVEFIHLRNAATHLIIIVRNTCYENRTK